MCLSVSSINAWASNGSLNGGSTWRPRPKLLVRSCPVVVAHSLPARFDSGRAGDHALHCLRARAPIIDQLPVVVAHSSSSVPGRLNRFVLSSTRVKCVGLSAFHASLKLCASYNQILVDLHGSFRFLVACLIDPAIPTQSGQTILPEAQRGTQAKAPCLMQLFRLDFRTLCR